MPLEEPLHPSLPDVAVLAVLFVHQHRHLEDLGEHGRVPVPAELHDPFHQQLLLPQAQELLVRVGAGLRRDALQAPPQRGFRHVEQFSDGPHRGARVGGLVGYSGGEDFFVWSGHFGGGARGYFQWVFADS